ncbi:hypothetical protein ACFYY8_33770 [Streptosporangium sp. NPDC001559]|uniref:hypothetical protein n=1 Tax=Streptosporangium sp. NPDC001559 TaxID=3366187 RepID=UPI0036EDB308
MTALLPGTGWLLAALLTVALAAQHLRHRPALRHRITALAARRARAARATLAATVRGITLHPRAPHHGRTPR